MRQKLLRRVVLFGMLLITISGFYTGCIDEPTISELEPMTMTARFVNAVRTSTNATPAIDVYINGEKKISNLAYGTNTAYLNSLKPGEWKFFVTVAGAPQDTIIEQNITLASLTQQTIVIYDLAQKTSFKVQQGKVLQSIERYTYSDETKKLGDTASVKIIHANYLGAAKVQLKAQKSTDTSATVVISGPLSDATHQPTTAGIDYGQPSPYSYPFKKLLFGNYTFSFVNAGNGLLIKDIVVDISKAKRYTFALVGDATDPKIIKLDDDLAP